MSHKKHHAASKRVRVQSPHALFDAPGKEIELTAERMTYGSDAIAHDSEGKTVFVGGAVAGDRVRAKVYQDGPSFSKAITLEVLSPSPNRVASPCPYAGICGGCPWAILSRDAQLAAKRANVVDSLRRIGHFSTQEAEKLVHPCESPSDPWGYRNKIELAFSQSVGRTLVGMHGTDPSQVVKVDACPLLDSRHKGAVKSVAGALSYLASSDDLGLDRVGIRIAKNTRDIEVALWGQPGPFPRSQVAKVLGDALHPTSVVHVLSKGPAKARRVTGVEVLAGKGHWDERICGQTMSLSAPSFFQVNMAGAERLIELVLEGLEPTEDDEAMDLYCGAGTFTLPLAERCGFVSSVEAYGPAVRDLRRNLDNAGMDNVDPVGGDAGREFPETDADLIVVDPPRAGLAPDVVKKLSAQPARKIAYVSCDPATLARDLARFREIGAFEPVSVTPVDLFPQTFHVENVTILERRYAYRSQAAL